MRGGRHGEEWGGGHGEERANKRAGERAEGGRKLIVSVFPRPFNTAPSPLRSKSPPAPSLPSPSPHPSSLSALLSLQKAPLPQAHRDPSPLPPLPPLSPHPASPPPNPFRKPLCRKLIVVEGIYANTGDVAQLDKIYEIKERYKVGGT